MSLTRPSLPPITALGFDHDLYVMPFDHRGSFEEKLLGLHGRPPGQQDVASIISYKRIIYDGFKKAIVDGVPKARAAILVDEKYGSDILKEAHAEGFYTACPAEKSGQAEFDFEYGAEFGSHIAHFNPTFVKALVRYSPEGDETVNRRQRERLKQLSDYCHTHGNKLILELLLLPTPEQNRAFGGNHTLFDQEMRPLLTPKAMKELQQAGIDPDVWKLEGMENEDHYHQVVLQARSEGRGQVCVIVLGRGESNERVRLWLRLGAHVPGVVGFAIGRTLFWEPLKDFRSGKIKRHDAVDQIAQNYKHICDLWMGARRKDAISA